MDKSILRNIAVCYQNRNSSQTFCVKNLQKFQEIAPGGVTF